MIPAKNTNIFCLDFTQTLENGSKLKPPQDVGEEEEILEPLPGHPTWSGGTSIGLVNIPVRAIPITLERKVSFRMLHLHDGWAARSASDFSRAAKAIEDHPERLTFTLGFALIAHLINIASLYFLFLAFHQPIALDPLVAGYAMGILFWNVSPVPQGIGVVEGVMTLVYSSLGIHRTVAVLVVLAFRGLNFWLPMLVGFILLRKAKIFGPKQEA